jgi:hypothetical protein
VVDACIRVIGVPPVPRHTLIGWYFYHRRRSVGGIFPVPTRYIYGTTKVDAWQVGHILPFLSSESYARCMGSRCVPALHPQYGHHP